MGALGVNGALLSRLEYPTEAHRGPAAVLAAVEQGIRDVQASLPEARGIGVACAGQIDPGTGTVVHAPNLEWSEVPLGRTLACALGRPVTVENDVRAAAWGEFALGAGRGAHSLVAVLVGTGVGSGAVLNGSLWRGAGNAAGELGHTQVVPDGLPCGCGRRGCLEQYVAGNGFQRRLQAILASDAARGLVRAAGGQPGTLTARMVYETARGGDALARRWWEEAEGYLTLAVANYVTLLNPEVLVLGGGVVEAVPALFDAVAAGVPARTTLLAARSLRIVRPALGGWSGVVGAAALATAAA